MSRFPLFETLAIQDGEVQNLDYHQARVEFACRHYLKSEPSFHLKQIIQVPTEYQEMACVRCRVDYHQAAYQVQFFPYQPRQILQFQCVETVNLDYRFKYTDRRFFESLPTTPTQEVIILNNGKVSDCTIGNLLFLNQGNWFSPQDYLLKGTQLSRLLDEKVVTLCEITRENLLEFEQIMLINALNPFDPRRALPLQAVRF